jgi:hypothetical protein
VWRLGCCLSPRRTCQPPAFLPAVFSVLLVATHVIYHACCLQKPWAREATAVPHEVHSGDAPAWTPAGRGLPLSSPCDEAEVGQCTDRSHIILPHVTHHRWASIPSATEQASVLAASSSLEWCHAVCAGHDATSLYSERRHLTTTLHVCSPADLVSRELPGFRRLRWMLASRNASWSPMTMAEKGCLSRRYMTAVVTNDRHLGSAVRHPWQAVSYLYLSRTC